ncbi:Serine/threonine-protein phosphatase 2A regulatory subunit B'' subunit alpha [Coemansia erecta]|nr:Serine/threonine-protein phosphatase 2A regulatory subunit B'' subunit alpha [Coemansia erecta]
MGLATENVAPMATPQKKSKLPLSSATGSSPILQADELSLNPRWSPQLKSPRPNTTISSRLRQQGLAHADSDDLPNTELFGPLSAGNGTDGQLAAAANVIQHGRGVGGLVSPLSKRARILQTGSPECLPPLSPVVSSRKRALRSDLTQDTPFPFSPTASGLRIRYSPSSPLSPTLRTTPNRGEPESPTLSRILARDSPSLSLDEKLGSSGNIEDESPTMSQMSRSLLFRLDLESPTARRASGAAADDSKVAGQSPFVGPDKGKRSGTSLLRHSPLLSSGEEQSFSPAAEKGDENSQPRRQSSLVRRSSLVARSSSSSTKSESKRRKLAPSKDEVVPQIYVSPLHPRIDREFDQAIKQQLAKTRKHFERSFGAREVDFAKITQECGLPRFANRALFRYVTRDMGESSKSALSGNAVIGKRSRQTDRETWPSFEHFCRVWTRVRRASADIHALLFNILVDDATNLRPFLTRDDMKVIVSDVVDHHYELEFLEGQGQFLQSYTETVVERIFYASGRSWDGKMQLSQFRKINVAGILGSIEDGIDVNISNPGLFSYKHFYVLFCSFFELDLNRDSMLDARDLLRYFNGTLSRRIISRIMMGKGKPSEHAPKRPPNDAKAKAKAEKRRAKGGSRYDLNVRLSDCRMTYTDFIWFLLSEIDKTSPTAVEYWFRCLDLDGDGVLSIYELEYFYDEQISRMEEEMAGDIIMLDDLMCQLSDLVRPEHEGMITLKDLRRVPPTIIPVFFDAFMNLSRFVEHESRTSCLQRQLAQLSMRALPKTSFEDVIQMRIEFLASLPNPWSEFADLEYAALLNDHEQTEQNYDEAATADSSVDVAAA